MFKEVQMGSGVKSYMRKDFIIYEEMHIYCISPHMRRPLVIYDFTLIPLNFLIYKENFISFFISVINMQHKLSMHVFYLSASNI
jgi:hypothetical protein